MLEQLSSVLNHGNSLVDGFRASVAKAKAPHWALFVEAGHLLDVAVEAQGEEATDNGNDLLRGPHEGQAVGVSGDDVGKLQGRVAEGQH